MVLSQELSEGTKEKYNYHTTSTYLVTWNTHPSSAAADNALGDVLGVGEAAVTDVFPFELHLFDLLFLLSERLSLFLSLPLCSLGLPTTGLTSMGEAVINILGLSGHSSASSKSTSVFGLLVIESGLPGGGSFCVVWIVEPWCSRSSLSLITTLQNLKRKKKIERVQY